MDVQEILPFRPEINNMTAGVEGVPGRMPFAAIFYWHFCFFSLFFFFSLCPELVLTRRNTRGTNSSARLPPSQSTHGQKPLLKCS